MAIDGSSLADVSGEIFFSLVKIFLNQFIHHKKHEPKSIRSNQPPKK